MGRGCLSHSSPGRNPEAEQGPGYRGGGEENGTLERKRKFLWPGFSADPGRLACCTRVGNTLLLMLYKELRPGLGAAWLQEGRGWGGGSAEGRD